MTKFAAGVLVALAVAFLSVSLHVSSRENFPGEVIFSEAFDNTFTLEQVWPSVRSGHADWWVSSGGYLISENGSGRTLKGNLLPSDRFAMKYANSNPRDTAKGFRPQNVFRLVLRENFLNATQELRARVIYYEPSSSEYRNESNGVLLFNRYQDESNLYYVGIRVDGNAVIKKKLNGRYSTLDITPVFSNKNPYNREANNNFLPLNSWIGIKSLIKNIEDDKVQIELFIDQTGNGKWKRVLSVVDDGVTYGPAITKSGYGGIRTDFMDVEFDDYRIAEF